MGSLLCYAVRTLHLHKHYQLWYGQFVYKLATVVREGSIIQAQRMGFKMETVPERVKTVVLLFHTFKTQVFSFVLTFCTLCACTMGNASLSEHKYT
jgi:hypothetical protein